MQASRIDGTHFVPEGPAPPRPPERLRPSEDAPDVRAAGARLELTASVINATLVNRSDNAAGPSDLVSAADLEARVRAHVREMFEKAGIAYEDITAEEAHASIVPGGYWSAEAVSKRIVDFVAAFANGDSERAQLLRDAVEQGFGEAEQAFGGRLPDISHETMDLVREGLDRLFQPRVDATA